MKSLSIKIKVILTVIICLAVAGAGLGALFERAYEKNVHLATVTAVNNARTMFANLQAGDVQKMAAAAELLMANPQLRQAFKTDDINQLIEINQPLFNRLKAAYGVTILNYITLDEKRYLTMTTPYDLKLRGQKAIRPNIQACAKTKTWANGMALGKLGFALRVTHPFYDNGELKGDKQLGYIELGSEIGGLLGVLKQQTSNEFGLMMLKKFFKEEDWAAQRKLLKLENNWSAAKDILLANNTSGKESIFKYTGDVTALPDAGLALDIVQNEGKQYARGAFPIRDASNAKVGALFVLVDITEQFVTMQRMKWLAMGSIGAVILVLCVLLIALLQRLVFRRLETITVSATRLVGGDFETPLPATSDDEIGRFEALFEQFRVVFVNVLKDLEALQRQD